VKSIVLLFLSLLILGCSSKKISEKQFDLIWREYIQREFEESFDEKQSTAQKEKIFKDILSNYSIPLDEFKSYMMKNHKDKYKIIFLEQ